VIGWMEREDARVWIEPAVAGMGVGEAIPAPEPWSSEVAAVLSDDAPVRRSTSRRPRFNAAWWRARAGAADLAGSREVPTTRSPDR